jgi:N-acetylglucosamine kinase-like BadF-type ATPase
VEYLLGMDAGGTKTVSVLVDVTGRIVGFGHAGCGNFQVSGAQRARQELSMSIERAIHASGIPRDRIQIAYYGISGADREKDFQIIHDILTPINPARRMYLENDTAIALRAGTEKGFGLGLISGTGTNAIGFNEKGERMQVGGWGSPYLGDYGSAHDIAASAFAAAQRGHDGRGPPTLLYERISDSLGLASLIDICERDFFDSYNPLDIASFAPLVFETAREGDRVAIQILERAGREVSLAALAVLRALFSKSQEIPVVLGGSVFQKGTHGAMVSIIEREIRNEFPLVKFRILQEEPVCGAVLCAADRYFHEKIPGGFRETVVSSMKIEIVERKTFQNR